MTKLRATAESFLPRPPDSPRRLCRFFQFGTCRYGNNCQYLHTAPEAQPIDQFTAIEEEELATEILKLASEKNSANKGEGCSSCVRTIDGATVTFDTGAEVRSITIPKPCEYSHIGNNL